MRADPGGRKLRSVEGGDRCLEKRAKSRNPEFFFFGTDATTPLDGERRESILASRSSNHRRDAEVQKRIPSRTGAMLGWQASDLALPGFCFALGR